MYHIPKILTGGSILLLQAACPPKSPATTDPTSEPESTTPSGTTDELTSTAMPTSTDIGTTTGDTTTAAISTTSGDSTTTTTDDLTEGPSDPGCTYPGSTSGGASSPDVDDACACVEGTSVVCGAKICPTITGSCDDFGYDEACSGTWQYADEALTCAIKAAAAGTEGTIEWRFTPDGGFSERSGFLHIVAERRAIRQDVNVLDLSGYVSDTELWNLDDPAWFDGCLDLTSFCERMACFFDGTDGAALSLCQDGYILDYSY